jgi:hypothetical protein
MTDLAEIKVAVESLSAEEQQQLMLFIAARLRSERTGRPPPRDFSLEQIRAWIAKDEEDMRRFNEGK